MSHFVNLIDGMSGSTAAQLSNIAISFIDSTGGVVGTNDYAVAVNGHWQSSDSPNNTVGINLGRAYVPNATGTMMYSTYLDTATSGGGNVTIGPNSSGNPRIDAIVLYLDLSASPNTQASNVAKFADVQGTPAGSPSAPNNSQILTAIGSGNPYIVLATVAVANGFTSITSGNLTDQRSFASFSTGNVVPVNTYEEFTNQGADPSSPSSGKLRVYSKSDNVYSKNSSGVITPIGSDPTFVGSFANFVSSGLTAPTAGSLTTTFASGVVYYGGTKYSVAGDGGHTYTASKDTYVDVNPATGAFTYSAVTTGAAAPSLTASSVRVAKVVTSGSAVTGVIQDGTDSNGVLLYPQTPFAATRYRQPVVTDWYENGTVSSGTPTIDWSKGDRQHITLGASSTFTYTNAKQGQALTLSIDEDGTGGRTITLPAGTKWPNGATGSFVTTTSALNTIVVLYDGTNYRTNLSAGFA